MTDTAVIENLTDQARQRQRLPIALAFLAIYVVWGSTFLAIRVAVATVPPLFAAGTRFVIAGAALYLWSRLSGVPNPTRLEWRNLSIIGTCMFLIAYAGLFWAEKTVPSGLASVIVATIPVWTTLFEVFVFKRGKLRGTVVLALATGLAGVIILVPLAGTSSTAVLSALAIVASDLSWAFGSVLSKGIHLPSSKLMSAAGQMLTGGAMLLVASASLGELHPFPHVSLQAAGAIAYLITAGSILAFSSYTWLLARLPATKVSSYAYVNPVIALALGHWFGGEPFTLHTLFGTLLVLGGVILLLGNFGRKQTSADDTI
ncbi:MAG TPA: EamA family transporter [Bryobacteraceae bacterium]|jgi:drug/metabolite transporter (DMT)-like permease|nr:EamA family transporter [Bryobacteraceae bacterium]